MAFLSTVLIYKTSVQNLVVVGFLFIFSIMLATHSDTASVCYLTGK